MYEKFKQYQRLLKTDGNIIQPWNMYKIRYRLLKKMIPSPNYKKNPNKYYSVWLNSIIFPLINVEI